MATRGPVPERSDERRRRNKNPDGPVTKSAAQPLVVAPPADPGWHPMAADWYESLALSGQARFYEPSDWETARVWSEVLSRELLKGRMSAQMIAAWSGASTELLTTEGARRRGRLELERGEPDLTAEQAKVAVLAGYRRDRAAS